MNTEQAKFINFVMQQDPTKIVSHRNYATCFIGDYIRDQTEKSISNQEGIEWSRTNLDGVLRDTIGDTAPENAIYIYKDFQKFLKNMGYAN